MAGNKERLDEFAKKWDEVVPKDLSGLSEEELNKILNVIYKDLGVDYPWGDQSFDDFMNDPDAVLDFS